MSVINPYRGKPARCFWKTAIAERHVASMEELWNPIRIEKTDRIATAGSCFAQHIGKNLKIRGAQFLDLEPAPPVFKNTEQERLFGYGVFSCRYGNIYTSRQLWQLVQEAYGNREPVEVVWEKAGRYFDALRPGIDPVGFDTLQDVLDARVVHLAAVRQMLETLDLFVFTMGLTEAWMNKADGTVFPTAPGTIAGTYDESAYCFHNLRYAEIMDDMRKFWTFLKKINPTAQMLLTVSPVPLIATATEQHVLSATTYSKSVLRAVAGDLTSDFEGIIYFPSYEIISGHPSRGFFFDPDMRSVNQFGVDLVMKHFFSGVLSEIFLSVNSSDEGEFDVVCDESKILDLRDS